MPVFMLGMRPVPSELAHATLRPNTATNSSCTGDADPAVAVGNLQHPLFPTYMSPIWSAPSPKQHKHGTQLGTDTYHFHCKPLPPQCEVAMGQAVCCAVLDYS